MKRLVFLLIALSSAFAATFGYSRIYIERTWTVDSDGSPFDLTASIGINNSNQHVLSIETDPDAQISKADDGTIWLHYQGQGSRVITAKAMVDINYDTNITSDSPVPNKRLDSTNLTEANEAMASTARKLEREESSLNTIANLVNWVHSYVAYDLAYWGKIKSAEDVFSERRGVCVEYTHLLISMARALGFETRYVSGYVYADAWQPHAWAEIDVPGYGWLSADPTFGELGALDDTHYALHYGTDQSSTYDVLLSKNQDAKIDVSDKLTTDFASEDPKGVNLTLDIDQQTYTADVGINNTRPQFVFGTYAFFVPDGYGSGNQTILLLYPNQTTHRFSGLNHSIFNNSYLYNVPIQASFNDAKQQKLLGVNSPEEEQKTAAPCIPSFIFALLFFHLLKTSK